jgi:hypothetical protein
MPRGIPARMNALETSLLELDEELNTFQVNVRRKLESLDRDVVQLCVKRHELETLRAEFEQLREVVAGITGVSKL